MSGDRVEQVVDMDEERFWAVIQRCIDEGTGGWREQSEILTAQLQALSAEEIESFCRIHEELRQRAYTWELWGAFFIIGGGCSDDEFSWLLSWLIWKGRQWYERTLANPDDLADYPAAIPEEGWEQEDAAHMASEIHFHKFDYFPGVELVGAVGEPEGERWEDRREVFRSRWPRLFEKYGRK